MIPDYVLNSRYAIINKYELQREYGMYKLQYIKVPVEEVGKRIDTDINMSYGALSNIYECDYIAIDVDNLIDSFDYLDENNVWQKFRNIDSRAIVLTNFIKQIFLEFKSSGLIERIDVFQSSAYLTSTMKIPIHIYIKLNKAVNTESFYKNYLISQIICAGYLTFIIYNGHSNIRIAEKQIKDSSKLKTTNYGSKITPLFSMTKNLKITSYPGWIRYLELEHKNKNRISIESDISSFLTQLTD